MHRTAQCFSLPNLNNRRLLFCVEAEKANKNAKLPASLQMTSVKKAQAAMENIARCQANAHSYCRLTAQFSLLQGAAPREALCIKRAPTNRTVPAIARVPFEKHKGLCDFMTTS